MTSEKPLSTPPHDSSRSVSPQTPQRPIKTLDLPLTPPPSNKKRRYKIEDQNQAVGAKKARKGLDAGEIKAVVVDLTDE